MNVNIKIITLNPESANVQELRRQLAEQGLQSTCFPGVDGRKGMPELEPDESINQARSLKMNLIEMTSTEVGCYLSHLRVINEAYKAGTPRLCVLEDDVLIENTFKSVLLKILELPDEVEFVRLMGLKMHKRKLVIKLDESNYLTRPVKGLCGAQGYVINRAGMKKVIDVGCNISEPIDKFFDHYWDIPLKCYGIEPHLIWERPRKGSSVAKQSRDHASKPLGKSIQKHLVKLVRGFRRRSYMMKHWREFSPATRPTKKLGRTERIH